MALEKFHYKLTTYGPRGGEQTYEIVLPKFENLPFGLIRKYRREAPAEQFFLILEGVLTEKDLDNLDNATQKEVSGLFDAWQKDSNITVGES